MQDEDVKEFLIEGYEHLNQIEGDLVLLEQNNSDLEVMNRIYRSLHTIKGNSGFLALENLERITHAGENLLSRLRDRSLALTASVTDALLQVVDAIKHHFEALETTNTESDADFSALLFRLNRLQESGDVGENEAEISTDPPLPPLPQGGVQDAATDAPLPQGGVQLPATDAALPPLRQGGVQQPKSAVVAETDSDKLSVADTAIRVDVAVLDKLMNLVGELVLCRNEILEFSNNEIKDDAFKSVSGRLNLVTSELQEGVMKTRMQPIRTLWSKFPRVVRDTAMSLGKQVRLEMEGEDTELDKTLIEAIANPLTHLIRNCLDHGLGTPEERTAVGKSPVGRVCLRAYHESGQVTIEVSDDGKGINSDRIKQKAIQRGMISLDRAMQMSDQEALNLIFLPGFSTAEQITNISGRGVGMDVVRTNLEKVNGNIDVHSRVGQGTTFKLKIPLTLAIIPTLIITSGGDRFAIPQVNLVELVRLEGEPAIKSIEMFHDTPVYRLRERLLPLVYLNRELKLDRGAETKRSPITNYQLPITNYQLPNDDVLNIVVVQATDKPFGLVVDTINDTQEIVVKPLGKQLRTLNCFAGATIMGDGKIALILDVQGIAQRTHILSEQEKALLAEENVAKQAEEPPQQLLLVQGPDARRIAISLANVCRLEEISPTILERVGKQHVIQYREQIVPLIDISYVFGGVTNNGYISQTIADEESAKDEKLRIVVVSLDGEKYVGLVVERVLDIVEQVIEVKGGATQEGILYCAVIQGQVTEIIDLPSVISSNLFGGLKMLAVAR